MRSHESLSTFSDFHQESEWVSSTKYRFFQFMNLLPSRRSSQPRGIEGRGKNGMRVPCILREPAFFFGLADFSLLPLSDRSDEPDARDDAGLPEGVARALALWPWLCIEAEAASSGAQTK